MQNLTRVTGAKNVGKSDPSPVHLDFTPRNEYTGTVRQSYHV